ncbi:MAG: AraC family transcriptional regulator [Phocaeicola sp.]|uniref:helix-turn-helix domain-containing protein n=1 Tax=Phocaeicola sp. TaxID=2773926 RepID=UPI0023C38D51|nr:AraC family transcriptional regulator [Phocaeicola sp.]MDE5678241.1 AraC family transcriptional regulator [Phocaeicola sp.]MDE6179726.1 AraC family transcriptional regulator [Phocaeicola sp.]
MKHINDIGLINTDKDFIAEVDITGSMRKIYHYPQRMTGCLFILCLRGECDITIHLSEYQIKENNIVTILPETFVHVHRQSPDCRLFLVGFNKELLSGTHLFNSTMSYLSLVIESPVTPLRPELTRLFRDYFMVLLRMKKINEKPNKELAGAMLLTILHGISSIHQDVNTPIRNFNRGDEIVKRLVQHIIKHYTQERSVTFYADLLHISPQHLSTTVNKVTGKTVTDIIAKLVITDAQAKLKSTDLTIQEIAYSLNFPDISFFGKYFKRYTGMSPKQYRESV